MEKYIITERSHNAKTGPIMVVTSASATCPNTCPLKEGGCYAKAGPPVWHWRGLDRTAPGETFQLGKVQVAVHGLDALIAAIKRQAGKLWRFNQAGDLPGEGNTIDSSVLSDLVVANKGSKGFTYTHKPVLDDCSMVDGVAVVRSNYVDNRRAIQSANAAGFTINLSADNLAHADQLADLNIAPVAAVLPETQTANTVTPKGRKVVVCPATIRDDVTCASCGLCQRQRDFIIGFPATGSSKRKASAIASA